MGLEKINVWKKEHGLTNDELAKLSGVPKSTIDKITSGLTYDPKLGTIKAIIKALGKTINDLDVDELNEGIYRPIQTDLTQLEQSHIKKYRDISPDDKQVVDAVLNMAHKHTSSLSSEVVNGDTDSIRMFRAAKSTNNTIGGSTNISRSDFDKLEAARGVETEDEL